MALQTLADTQLMELAEQTREFLDKDIAPFFIQSLLEVAKAYENIELKGKPLML